jgi:hypothetical protein
MHCPRLHLAAPIGGEGSWMQPVAGSHTYGSSRRRDRACMEEAGRYGNNDVDFCASYDSYFVMYCQMGRASLQTGCSICSYMQTHSYTTHAHHTTPKCVQTDLQLHTDKPSRSSGDHRKLTPTQHTHTTRTPKCVQTDLQLHR